MWPPRAKTKQNKTEEQLLSVFQRDKQGQPAEDPSVGNSAQQGSVQLAPLIDQSAPLRSKNNNNHNRGISQRAQNVPEGRATQCSGAARVQHHGAVPQAMLSTVSSRTEPGVIRHEAVQTPALEQHDCQAGTPQMASLLRDRTEKQSLCHGKNTSFCAGTKFCPKYFSSMKGMRVG